MRVGAEDVLHPPGLLEDLAHRPGDRGDVRLGLAHLVELLGQEVPEDDLQVQPAQVPVVPHAQDLGLGVRLAVATVVGLDLKSHVQIDFILGVPQLGRFCSLFM